MNNPDAITCQIEKNLQQIKQQIFQACKRAERSVDDVRLVAVTKYAKIEWVQALVSLGITDLGESRPQQLVERAAMFDDSIQWHLIGHLQRNKVRPVLPVTAYLHSVDSIRLLKKINQEAQKISIRPQVLIEMNISVDVSKDGFSIDLLESGWEQILQYNAIDIVGLMTMAPRVNHPEEARPVFTKLRELRNVINDISTNEQYLRELSMGMSNDFEIAIEEGATMIRVGSKLYEGLT